MPLHKWSGTLASVNVFPKKSAMSKSLLDKDKGKMPCCLRGMRPVWKKKKQFMGTDNAFPSFKVI